MRTALLFHHTPQSVFLDGVRAILAEQLPAVQLVYEVIHSDRQSTWEGRLRQLADEQTGLLILTVGGIDPTGCVPDATIAVCNKTFPGFGTLIRQTALHQNPVALLWRNTAGLRHHTLIVNLPDSIEAIQSGLPALFPGIPNAIRLAQPSTG